MSMKPTITIVKIFVLSYTQSKYQELTLGIYLDNMSFHVTVLLWRTAILIECEGGVWHRYMLIGRLLTMEIFLTAMRDIEHST